MFGDLNGSSSGATTATPVDYSSYRKKLQTYATHVLQGKNPNPVDSKVEDLPAVDASPELEIPDNIRQEIIQAILQHDLHRLKIVLGPALAPKEQDFRQASAKRRQRFEQAQHTLKILADEILPRAQWYARQFMFEAWWKKNATLAMKTTYGTGFNAINNAYTDKYSEDPIAAIDAYKEAMAQNPQLYSLLTAQKIQVITEEQTSSQFPQIIPNFHTLLRSFTRKSKDIVPYQADSFESKNEQPSAPHVTIDIATANAELQSLINSAARYKTIQEALFYLYKEAQGRRDLCSKYIPEEQTADQKQLETDRSEALAEYLRNSEADDQYINVGKKPLDNLKFDAPDSYPASSHLTVMHLAMLEYARAKARKNTNETKNCHKIIMYLLERGASPEITNGEDQTAYEYAGLTPLDVPSEWHETAIQAHRHLLMTATDPTVHKAFNEADQQRKITQSAIGWFLYASYSPLSLFRQFFTNVPDRDRLLAEIARWYLICGTAQTTHKYTRVAELLQVSLISSASKLTKAPKQISSHNSSDVEMRARLLPPNPSRGGYGSTS